MVEWATNAFGEYNVRWWHQSGVLVHDKNDPMKMTPCTVFTFEYEEDATAFELRWADGDNR